MINILLVGSLNSSCTVIYLKYGFIVCKFGCRVVKNCSFPYQTIRVAAACADRSIRLLDADVAEIGVFTGHKDYINDLAFSYSPEQLDPLLASVSGMISPRYVFPTWTLL
jgi:hypothetical protein